MKCDRYLGSATGEVPVKFQSDWKSLIPNLVASRLHEICGKTSFRLVNRGPASVIAPHLAQRFLYQLTTRIYIYHAWQHPFSDQRQDVTNLHNAVSDSDLFLQNMGRKHWHIMPLVITTTTSLQVYNRNEMLTSNLVTEVYKFWNQQESMLWKTLHARVPKWMQCKTVTSWKSRCINIKNTWQWIHVLIVTNHPKKKEIQHSPVVLPITCFRTYHFPANTMLPFTRNTTAIFFYIL